MSAQHTSVSVVYSTSGGAVTSTTMVQAEFSSRGPATFTPWHVCQVCDLSYAEGDGVLIGGAFYCFRNHCYEDLPEYNE
jgi:hypothetical protein